MPEYRGQLQCRLGWWCFYVPQQCTVEKAVKMDIGGRAGIVFILLLRPYALMYIYKQYAHIDVFNPEMYFN